MRIDLPFCDFQNCRRCQDGNCVTHKNIRTVCNYYLLREYILSTNQFASFEEWATKHIKDMQN